MSVKPVQMMELIRQVTAPDPRERELSADRSVDWLAHYSRSDVALLAGALSVAAACERDPAALESQLNALLELGSVGLMDIGSLERLREIDRAAIPANLVGYVEDLLEP
ncbi:hypothetical protein [Streptomyces erythrochromogenes]|uniref:hypothetical protein n=1 Tax=Streptomyces erythrochromogenes TaxID=285574 RepID=UPI00386D835F|nr:hypothetical protein OG364_11200 [Streptomyces erythrochromogenes]